MCNYQIYIHRLCDCRRSILHLCSKTLNYTPCPRPEPPHDDKYHQSSRCPYHEYRYQHPESKKVPESVGRIISNSGNVNESADAERMSVHGTNSKEEPAIYLIVFYFSPMEECAGRVTMDEDGILRRFSLEGIEIAVKKVKLSEVWGIPKPPPPPLY